ncbi:AvrD family protein, partial [Brevibacterium luteolum]|uniref:AvrD family protein n=1 Tax=Brevibacterium luteolum TaxID=199591 RepID=UPI001C242C02
MDHNDGWHPISLEDALGPASGRYFGAEYRHVHHELRDLRVAEELTAQGTVRYPSGWSMAEDGRERTPHLSTIDAVTLPLIALDAAGACSSNQYVSRIVLRAGSRPWFALDGVPVKMQLERPPMNA